MDGTKCARRSFGVVGTPSGSPPEDVHHSRPTTEQLAQVSAKSIFALDTSNIRLYSAPSILGARCPQELHQAVRIKLACPSRISRAAIGIDVYPNWWNPTALPHPSPGQQFVGNRFPSDAVRVDALFWDAC